MIRIILLSDQGWSEYKTTADLGEIEAALKGLPWVRDAEQSIHAGPGIHTEEHGRSLAEYAAYVDTREHFCPDCQDTGVVIDTANSGNPQACHCVASDFPMTDWQYEVGNGDTKLGHREWLQNKLELKGE
jgi:hypothetical protein